MILQGDIAVWSKNPIDCIAYLEKKVNEEIVPHLLGIKHLQIEE